MTENYLTHIRFSGIGKSYRKKRFGIINKNKPILKSIDIALHGGECILLTGKNGSGKSTLLRIMAGLLKPDSALINTGLETLSWKKSCKTLRQRVMYLYQEPYMFDGSVIQNLAYALHGKHSRDKLEQALTWARLDQHADTTAKCLSGGERQRVALAQAWLKQPAILLLDEPTANMDNHSRQRTEDLLCKLKDSGTALLIASHDLNHFQTIMDRRFVLDKGEVIEINSEIISGNVSIFPGTPGTPGTKERA